MNHFSFRPDDVNQWLYAFQSIVVVPNSAIGVRACSYAGEVALVILTGGIATVYGISHCEKNAGEKLFSV